MVFVETSFPRGGKIKPKPEKTESSDIKEIFGATVKKKPTIQKEKDPEKDVDETKLKKSANTTTLTPFTSSCIRISGLSVMGCVKSIAPTAIKIQLPGNNTGIVKANSISDSYVRQLTKLVDDGEAPDNYKSLDEMFKIGQLVSVKLMSTAQSAIECSMNPKILNAEIHHSKLKANYIISGSIDEIEDHGCVIDTGIKNLRAFLPKPSKGIVYAIGEIVLCAIEKIDVSATESTAVMRAVENKKLKFHEFEESDLPTLEMLQPRAVVKFTVDQIVKSSLQGSICEGNFQAIVIPNHFTTPAKTASSYFVGQELSAQVVCVMPLTKIVYLSLNLSPIRTTTMSGMLPLDTVVNEAVVERCSENRIDLKLGDHMKGSIFKPTQTHTVGQKIKVKLLAYNMFDRLYFCSDDHRLLVEHNFTIKKLKVGDKVDFIVKMTTTNGVKGWIGVHQNLNGFIHNDDLSMKQLKRNDIITSRILTINKEKKRVRLTNRVEFMDDDKYPILLDRSHAEAGKIFAGLVIKTFDTFSVIRFFNQIEGTITKTPANEKRLKVGKVSNFKVDRVRNGKIYLELATLEGKTETTNDVGKIIKAKIIAHLPTGVQIDLGNDSPGFVSSLFFSSDPQMSQLLCNSYKDGYRLKCVNLGQNVYSVRDVDYFKKNRVQSFDEIDRNDVLRGFVKNMNEDSINVFVPVNGMTKWVRINKKFISDKKVPDTAISIEQPIYVRVVDKLSDSLMCTAKLSDIWQNNFDSTMDTFSEYLRDFDKLLANNRKAEQPLAMFDIGQQVEATVTSVGSLEMRVSIGDSNVIGVIGESQYSPHATVGSTVKVTILWIDFVTKEINCTTKLRGDLDENIPTDCYIDSQIILSKDQFIVVMPKPKTLPFMYIPKAVHFNDFHSCMKSYIHSKKAKVKYCKKYSTFDLAIFDNFHRSFQNVAGSSREETVVNKNGKRTRKIDDDQELMRKLKMMKRIRKVVEDKVADDKSGESEDENGTDDEDEESEEAMEIDEENLDEGDESDDDFSVEEDGDEEEE